MFLDASIVKRNSGGLQDKESLKTKISFVISWLYFHEFSNSNKYNLFPTINVLSKLGWRVICQATKYTMLGKKIIKKELPTEIRLGFAAWRDI